ncbi:MAG: A/G-specific adenine glycosylase [Nitrosomonas sp.]|nr:A/G-specific adenine glycosylase [Nitrosomonas sp.]MDP1950103.1 A/G-specific adenine glycosylase [Nitrosomonas sp.]
MSSVATRLIHWHKHDGRHHLPWQGSRDPYAIWLSEIMLQQTQVATVIPYYQRFMQRFPTCQSLALAPLDDVLALWSGLGYYARARHLHQAARSVMQDYHGNFPQQQELIQQLPGIGRSTAAAIAVFAFGERCAILDGNVKRVFARYAGIGGYPGTVKIQNLLWQKAHEYLPERNARQPIEIYTQALMDLGATVCTRSKPLCTACPLQQDCVGFRENRVAQFPAPKPHKSQPKKETLFLMLLNQKQILLEKRPTTGVWGGLWCPPEIMAGEDIARYCAQQYGLDARLVADMPPLDHTFTHFKLRIHPQLCHVVSAAASPQQHTRWMTLEQALQAAIPTPVRKLLRQLILSAEGSVVS